MSEPQFGIEFGDNGCYFIASKFGNNYGDKDTVAIEIQINGTKNTYCLTRSESLQIVQHLIKECGGGGSG